jgi:hypothetical protein
MFAHARFCRANSLIQIRVVSTIREQHRLRKQGAEENRTQPIVVRFAGREREMDRQAIGVHHRVKLARQAPS